MQPDGSVFGNCVAEIYNAMLRRTKVIAAKCEPSPTLHSTCARMVCEAAEEAVKKLREENPRHDTRIQ